MRDCNPSKKASFVIAAHKFLGSAKPSSSRLGAPSNSRFVTPLFSWSYHVLFPQLFYFDNHLRCLRGVGSTPCSQLCARYAFVLEEFPNSFPCHTYKVASRKSFRCHTYEKVG